MIPATSMRYLIGLILLSRVCNAVEPDAPPPAADGWCGAAAAVTLVQPGAVVPLVVQGSVPAIGEGPFHPRLNLEVDGRPVSSQEVGPGEFEIRVIAIGEPGAHRIRLSFAEVRALPAPDGRQVGALLRRLAFEAIGPAGSSWIPAGQQAAASDIVTVGGPAGLGAGWYAFEHWQGQAFRWMGAQAELALAPSDRPIRLRLDAEPGPGSPAAGCALRLTDNAGHLLDKVRVDRRAAYDLVFAVPSSRDQPVRLSVDGALPPKAGDPRQLCLRVFAITATSVDP